MYKVFILILIFVIPLSASTNLDLREANVTQVQFQTTDSGVNFDVTLYHDDDGENGYADHWQVESLNGTIFGRRVLSHPHGTVEFTRSATIRVDSEEWVIIRGHDSTHGYGGQLALLNIITSEKIFYDQGTEPQNMSSYFVKASSFQTYEEHSTTSQTHLSLSFLLLSILFQRKFRLK